MQAKRIKMHNGAKKTALALTFMFDEKIGYDRVPANSRIATAEKRQAPADQMRVVEHLKELSLEAWR